MRFGRMTEKRMINKSVKIRLLYIWNFDCGDYKLHNKGFNINSKYNITYDYLSNTIKISRNEQFIHNFWGNNISECFAVVGENGSGKTTFLNLLLEVCENLKNDNLLTGKCIVVYENELDNCIYIVSDNKKLRILSDESISYKRESANRKIFENLHVAYFHNVLNKTDYIQQNRCEYDFFIGQKIQYAFHITYEMNYDSLQMDKIKKYFENEAFQIIEFLYDYGIENTLSIPFPLPNSIYIGMSDDSRNSDYLLVEAKKRGFGEKENDAMNKVAEYRKRQSEFIEKLENGWIRDTLEQLLINCFKEYVFPGSGVNNQIDQKIQMFNKTMGKLCKKKEGISIKNACVYLAAELSNLNERKEKNYIITETINFINWLGKNSDVIHKFENKSLKCIEINTDSQNRRFVKELIENYALTSITYPFYEFSFGLSTGEYYFLSIFADLYHMKANKRIWKNVYEYPVMDEESNQILLLFDEAELSMHPRWQRAYMKWILDFCDNLFVNQNIQIIITTHSPILLSDFPAQNVIYMKKKKDLIDITYGDIKTFGNNVHTLYLNAFFLENQGVIGAFAEKKINAVAKEIINNQDLDRKKIKEIEKIINCIGENVLKNRLKELLHKNDDLTVLKHKSLGDKQKREIEDVLLNLRKQKEQLEKLINQLEELE